MDLLIKIIVCELHYKNANRKNWIKFSLHLNYQLSVNCYMYSYFNTDTQARQAMKRKKEKRKRRRKKKKNMLFYISRIGIFYIFFSFLVAKITPLKTQHIKKKSFGKVFAVLFKTFQSNFLQLWPKRLIWHDFTKLKKKKKKKKKKKMKKKQNKISQMGNLGRSLP